MNSLKQTLFSNWHAMRWIRLLLALILFVQAVQLSDSVFGILGGVFLMQALFNLGCNGSGGCAVPTKHSFKRDAKEVSFEEVK